jgi:hypothetical protein
MPFSTWLSSFSNSVIASLSPRLKTPNIKSIAKTPIKKVIKKITEKTIRRWRKVLPSLLSIFIFCQNSRLKSADL